jgi:hypothetical protein
MSTNWRTSGGPNRSWTIAFIRVTSCRHTPVAGIDANRRFEELFSGCISLSGLCRGAGSMACSGRAASAATVSRTMDDRRRRCRRDRTGTFERRRRAPRTELGPPRSRRPLAWDPRARELGTDRARSRGPGAPEPLCPPPNPTSTAVECVSPTTHRWTGPAPIHSLALGPSLASPVRRCHRITSPCLACPHATLRRGGPHRRGVPRVRPE